MMVAYLFFGAVLFAQIPSPGGIAGGGSGGGGSPTGAAGGDLAGTYPNPTLRQTIAHSWSVLQTFRNVTIGTTATNTGTDSFAGGILSNSASFNSFAFGLRAWASFADGATALGGTASRSYNGIALNGGMSMGGGLAAGPNVAATANESCGLPDVIGGGNHTGEYLTNDYCDTTAFGHDSEIPAFIVGRSSSVLFRRNPLKESAGDGKVGFGDMVVRFGETAAPTRPTVALAGLGAGNVVGTVAYIVSFVDASGESHPSPRAQITIADAAVDGRVALSSIQVGPTGTTARKIYRTNSASAKAGWDPNFLDFVMAGGPYWLLTTISNNTDTTYTDNIADADLVTRYQEGGPLNTQTPGLQIDQNGILFMNPILFATLGTPANGTEKTCSDCQPTSGIDDTCTSGGTVGWKALRVNSTWVCR